MQIGTQLKNLGSSASSFIHSLIYLFIYLDFYLHGQQVTPTGKNPNY